MNIIVLSASTAHFRHYARDFFWDPKTGIINPQRTHDLQFVKPNAIIMLPEWMMHKDQEFLDRVEWLVKELKMRRAGQ